MHYLLASLLLITPTASAQLYKSVDAQGRTYYCDTPCQPSDRAPITLAPLNRQPALPSPTFPASPTPKQHLLPEQESLPVVYSALEVQGLPTGQALRANNGTLTVHINVQPPLLNHHQLQLVLDDQPYGQPGTHTDLQLLNIDRGEHHLAVRVLESSTVVQQSPAVRFYLQRSYLKR